MRATAHMTHRQTYTQVAYSSEGVDLYWEFLERSSFNFCCVIFMRLLLTSLQLTVNIVIRSKGLILKGEG